MKQTDMNGKSNLKVPCGSRWIHPVVMRLLGRRVSHFLKDD